MNVQTWSRELAIVEALFRANGDEPYVLKPESLINPEAEKVFAKKVTLASSPEQIKTRINSSIRSSK